MARNISKLTQQIMLISLKSTRQFHKTILLYKNFAVRDFVFDKQGVGTNVNRFIKHIAIKNAPDKPLVKSEISYAQYYPLHDFRVFRNELKSTKTEQLPKLLSYTYTYKCNADINKFVDALNELDIECANRISSMKLQEILCILYGFMFLIPNRITQTEFYQNSLKRLVELLDNSCNKSELVETCFYLGMGKKNQLSSELLNSVISLHLEKYLDQLALMDFSIIINAAYKASVKITVDGYKKRAIDEICNMKDQPNFTVLTVLIKSLRHNRVNSENVLKSISEYIDVKSFTEMDFRSLTHVFAYVADNYYNDKKLCNNFMDISFKMIQNNYNFNSNMNISYRAKDIGTFVWCCAHLGISNFSETQINLIEKIIKHQISTSEYKYCPDFFVDIILSLWTIDVKLPQYLPEVQEFQSRIQSHPDRVKLDSRTNLLFTLAELETPEIFDSIESSDNFNDTKQSPEYLVKHRPALQKIYKILTSNLMHEFQIKQVLFVTQIKNLNISGIVLKFDDETKENLHIEVLDNTNTLCDKVTPTGLMKLKLRLLKRLNCNVIEVPGKIYDDYEYLCFIKTELQEYCQTDKAEELRVT